MVWRRTGPCQTPLYLYKQLRCWKTGKTTISNHNQPKAEGISIGIWDTIFTCKVERRMLPTLTQKPVSKKKPAKSNSYLTRTCNLPDRTSSEKILLNGFFCWILLRYLILRRYTLLTNAGTIDFVPILALCGFSETPPACFHTQSGGHPASFLIRSGRWKRNKAIPSDVQLYSELES